MTQPMHTALYNIAKNIVDHVAHEKEKLGSGHLAEDSVIELVQSILTESLHAEGFVRIESVGQSPDLEQRMTAIEASVRALQRFSS